MTIAPTIPTQDLPRGPEHEPDRLTSRRLLVTNTGWNLAGICLPILVAIFCFPILKRVLGEERLGVIALAWTVIGYFGIFDFGLSRALTKLVAEKLGQNRHEDIPSLIGTCLLLLMGVGLLGCVLGFAFCPWIVERGVKVPGELRSETLRSFYWLSAGVPVVVLTSGLRGVLEALQRFRLLAAIRAPMGVFSYLGPVLVLPFSHSLVPIVAALVLGRVVGCAAHLWACLRALPALRKSTHIDRTAVLSLARFGGWMTVSNIVAPLMISFDRFVIGGMVSMAAVAYYGIPSEAVTKLALFPAALVGVLFPAFSTAAARDESRLARMFESAVEWIFLLMLPVLTVVVAFAPEGLRLWVGQDFAQHSSSVLRYLAVAVFLNSVAQIPFAHVQSVGRPDITAKLHLTELPFYLATLFVLVRWWGIKGAAIAWLLRVALDTFALFYFSHRLLPSNRFAVSRWPVMAAAAILGFALAAMNFPLAIRIGLAALVCGSSVLATWFWGLTERDRTMLQSVLRGENALR